MFDPEDPEAVLVDPGEEPARFLAEAEQRGRRIGAIWLTHAHLDHILGVARIRAATGAPIHLHPADRPLYDQLPEQALQMGLQAVRPPAPDAALAHGQILRVGGAEFAVRHVPGHSPGHVCFVSEGVVLSGDVLFHDSIGRTDLPGGDFDTLIGSIRRELFSLPEATRVFPGHGPATSIGRERASNPFLRERGEGPFPPA